MSSLRVRIDEQLELYSKFLGSSDVVLKTIEIPMKVEEDRSSLKLFLQTISLKESLQKLKLKIKVEQVEGEAPTPQVILQKPNLKIKVKHVEEQVDL
jgi:hypothetical protein